MLAFSYAAFVDPEAAVFLLPRCDAVEHELPTTLHALWGNRLLRCRQWEWAIQERSADQRENHDGGGNKEADFFHAFAPLGKFWGRSV